MSEKQKFKDHTSKIKNVDKSVSSTSLTSLNLPEVDNNSEGNLNTSDEYRRLEAEICQKKRLYSSVNLAKLPDGGARLKKQIDQLEREMMDLKEVNSVCSIGNNGMEKFCEVSLEENMAKNMKGTSQIWELPDRNDSINSSDDEVKVLFENNYSRVSKMCETNLEAVTSTQLQLERKYDGPCENKDQKIYTKENSYNVDEICGAIKSVTISEDSNMQTLVLSATVNGDKNVTLKTNVPKNNHCAVQKEKNVVNDTKMIPHAQEDAVKLNTSSSIRSVISKLGENSLSHSESVKDDKQLSSVTKTNIPAKFSRNYLSFNDAIVKNPVGNLHGALPSMIKPTHWTNWRENNENRKIKLLDAQELPNHNLEESKEAKHGSTFFKYSRISKAIEKEQLLTLHNSLKTQPLANAEESDPEELRTKLMKHQRQALAWLLWREDQQPRGGILADDMGLGKTLTMISLVLKQKYVNIESVSQDLSETVCSNATLIVCLASVIHQWNGEIVKHCHEGSLKVFVHHGKNRNNNVECIAKQDVVLTTYGLIQSEGKCLEKSREIPPLFKIHWKRIILDEAHTIKNEKSMTSKCVCLLKSSCKWAVTGTPIHNNLKDMFTLLKFLRCSPFDDFQIWKKLAGDESHRSVERRNALMKSILFRRSKEQLDEDGKPLIELPKKIIMTHELKLEKSEREVYDELYNESKAKLMGHFGKRNSGGGSIKKLPSNDSISFLVLLLRLQQCCNHISLLQKEAEDDISYSDSAFSDISDIMSSLSIHDASKSPQSSQHDNIDLILNKNEWKKNFHKSVPSTKIKVLFEELNKISLKSSKQKSVVISQWVSMLEIVEFHLQKYGMLYHVITGSTKPEERAKIVTDFNENPDGPQIMLLSLKAGGVGLNLIGANHLFLLDIHWNPALESQACDRIHRVGQKLDSFIHKFVCKDTIETKILGLQEEKRYLAKNTLEGAGKISHRPTFEDLRHLFDV